MLKEVPIVFYTSKLKNFLLFLLCFASVLMALFTNKTKEIWYWAGLILFGFGSLIFLIQLIFPNSSYLKITEKGIETRTLFKTSFMPWKIIKDFEVGSIYVRFRRKKMVMINFDKTYNKQNFGRGLAKTMTGFEVGLPDNYGMKYKELAKILNHYKSKFKNV